MGKEIKVGTHYLNTEHCIGRMHRTPRYNDKDNKEYVIDFHAVYNIPYEVVGVTQYIVALTHPLFEYWEYVVTVAEFERCFKEMEGY